MNTAQCEVKQVNLVYKDLCIVIYYLCSGSMIYFWNIEKIALFPLPLAALESIIILICEAERLEWVTCQFCEVQTWLTFPDLKEGVSCLSILDVRRSETNKSLPSIYGFKKTCSDEDYESELAKAVRILVSIVAHP